MKNQQQAIVDAQVERDKLAEECFQLLYKITRKPSCIKLLNLAKDHLEMLSQYKTGRK